MNILVLIFYFFKHFSIMIENQKNYHKNKNKKNIKENIQKQIQMKTKKVRMKLLRKKFIEDFILLKEIIIKVKNPKFLVLLLMN